MLMKENVGKESMNEDDYLVVLEGQEVHLDLAFLVYQVDPVDLNKHKHYN